MSPSAFEAFQQKFNVQNLTVKRYQYWTWSVRPVQGTLGASIISLNRPAIAWSQVTREENSELSGIIADVERKLKTLFAYVKINYLMLMMIDDHVHFHVFPRYPDSRRFAEKEWVDSNWPKVPDLLTGENSPEILESIKVALSI